MEHQMEALCMVSLVAMEPYDNRTSIDATTRCLTTAVSCGDAVLCDAHVVVDARLTLLNVESGVKCQVKVLKRKNRNNVQYLNSKKNYMALTVYNKRMYSPSVFFQKVVTRHNCVLSKQPFKSLN